MTSILYSIKMGLLYAAICKRSGRALWSSGGGSDLSFHFPFPLIKRTHDNFTAAITHYHKALWLKPDDQFCTEMLSLALVDEEEEIGNFYRLHGSIPDGIMNHDGDWLGGFTTNLGVRTVMMVELCCVVYNLRLAWFDKWAREAALEPDNSSLLLYNGDGCLQNISLVRDI
ncbi:hypothetical protein RCOM_0981410 [Ricinus communis]|uniref:Uncharacterized protein n=1 Tax=Ricinus communis TaxID=3988 RepID=B9SVY1_RICCO|nr:hypothetical protein RCOM_0981410 [Ricinus communis]